MGIAKEVTVASSNGNGSNGHRKLVVVQLSGGNDALNTVVPYQNGHYYDNRPAINIPQDDVLQIDDQIGLRPGMEAFKRLWDEGKLAIIQGIGYPNPNIRRTRRVDGQFTIRSYRDSIAGIRRSRIIQCYNAECRLPFS